MQVIENFNPGDVVKLKNNFSPLMTVEGLLVSRIGTLIRTVWFDGHSNLHRDNFSADLLSMFAKNLDYKEPEHPECEPQL